MTTAKKALPLVTQEKRKLYLHIHGWFGAGKTWFAATAPGPVLFADVEGGAWDTPNPKVLWDDVKDDLSQLKGHKDLLVIKKLSTERELIGMIEMLMAGKYGDQPHPFESFVLDSLTMFQMKLKREVQKPGHDFNPDVKVDWDGWNRLLNHMLMRCEDLIEVKDPSHKKPVNVVLLSGTDREQTFARPLLEGNFRKRLPGIVDLHGFMRRDRVDGKNVPALYCESTDLIDAKNRLDAVSEKWPEGRIVNPTIPKILTALNER